MLLKQQERSHRQRIVYFKPYDANHYSIEMRNKRKIKH